MIRETQSKRAATSLGKNMIIAFLKKDIKLLENKSLDNLKKIIQTFIEKTVIIQYQSSVKNYFNWLYVEISNNKIILLVDIYFPSINVSIKFHFKGK